MKIKRKFSDFLDTPRNAKILSVILAAVIWLIVASTMSPNEERVIENVPITIKTEGTALETSNLSPVGVEDYTVDITVTGKRYTVGGLSAENFNVVALPPDVSDAGEYEFTVSVTQKDYLATDYTIVSYTPRTIVVNLREVQTEQFPLNVIASNIRAQEGYTLGEAYTNRDVILVSGPQEELDKINKVVLETYEEETINTSQTYEGEIVFYGSQGEKLELENTTHEKISLEITVPVLKEKLLKLKIGYTNVPEGVDADELEYTISPSEITIAAPAEVADSLTELNLGSIDFRRIDLGFEYVFDSIKVPAGVQIQSGGTSAKVIFPMEGMVSTTLSVDRANMSMLNVPDGYNWSIVTNRITDVKLVGSQDIIDNVTSEDVIATYDWLDQSLRPGNINVRVKITIPGKGLVWAVGEYNMVVSISERE